MASRDNAPSGNVISRQPRVAKVKNKAPAPVQISAEQLLREAKERQFEATAKPPKQQITDIEELDDYKLRKRKAFEDALRRNRNSVGNWIRYAQWEESLKEFARARSIYERALDVDSRNVGVWLKYIEMEMKHGHVNHARNIFDRATTILPRASQFWFKYTYMEEMLKNVHNARQVFERWLHWEPEEQAYVAYINLEIRYKEIDRARAVYERFIMVHPQVKNWIKYAKFEEYNNEIAKARSVFERAASYYSAAPDGKVRIEEKLFIAFARFEENHREYERARAVFKFAMDHCTAEQARDLYDQYAIFEKKHGDKAGIEDVVLTKRRQQYEQEVQANPHNYDAWFDYARLEESNGDIPRTREVYERAIACHPPVPSSPSEKRLWRRYIFLWIYYAVFEELVAKDVERARQVYSASLKVVPHAVFTFAKIWLMFAMFEIRQKNLKQARLILGNALGKCPKYKLFKGYIDLELELREFDRCRKLYEKLLETWPHLSEAWMRYAEIEAALGETERARGIYELAIDQPMLNAPEILWKAYIDFEIDLQELDRARQLYQRLLERTQHVRVWLSYAQFEMGIETEPEEVRVSRARSVFESADKSLKDAPNKEYRVLLLEAWRDFEAQHGTAESRAAIAAKMPSKVKKRRKVMLEDGREGGWEEYYDYVFPEEQAAAPSLKLLMLAQQWKQKQQELEKQKPPTA